MKTEKDDKFCTFFVTLGSYDFRVTQGMGPVKNFSWVMEDKHLNVLKVGGSAGAPTQALTKKQVSDICRRVFQEYKREIDCK